ncbi:hypothetical protein VB711_14835 [Cronbergia sp. UHCC 0137]|uniref:hypothetical protein n=1 Tax=Cronbergia sp. UHCC 0137 TaxID=3110239 RepID=UPI002B2138E7|nr:hypothetical protein [Cronbergia sp. UHCC 0137]MEA5619102.1 hypothetical protein [Cronbergia sp. UHCC 0137]
MKDNISLIAAATGGLMLSFALTGILKGSPIISWEKRISSSQIANVQTVLEQPKGKNIHNKSVFIDN